METLIEKLHNNNVIFSYYGFIDHTVLKQVLQITASKLEHNNEEPAVVTRVNSALNDCVENIISHNFYPDDERLHYKSLLVVSRDEDQYLIDTLNVINGHQKEVIDRQLEFLHSHSREELQDLVSTPSKCPVSARLITMVFKADEYDCSFKPIEENYLFNINFKILTPVVGSTSPEIKPAASPMLREKIFLTGFMGSGKSTVGKKLAFILKRKFYDLDTEIETSENTSISRIFATRGEAYFRDLEKKLLLEVIRREEDFVLSLGGGTLGSDEVTALVKNAGLLVYIDLPVAALVSRLASVKEERPLIRDLDGKELTKYIESKLQARILQYQQAHLTVNGLNLTAQELYKKIVGEPQANNI